MSEMQKMPLKNSTVTSLRARELLFMLPMLLVAVSTVPEIVKTVTGIAVVVTIVVNVIMIIDQAEKVLTPMILTDVITVANLVKKMII